MPIKKCKLGFDCGLMMMCVGITAEECENKETCGTISVLSQEEIEEEQLEAQRKHDKKYSFVCKNHNLINGLNLVNSTNYPVRASSYNFSDIEIILLYLLSRKCLVFANEEIPFAPTITEINYYLSNIISTINDVNFVIPPLTSEIHKYYVKRPYATYQYIQISAPTPIFKAVFYSNSASLSKKYNEFTTNVHLGKESSLKTLMILFASLNRDKITKAFTKLKLALNLIIEAFDILNSIDSEF